MKTEHEDEKRPDDNDGAVNPVVSTVDTPPVSQRIDNRHGGDRRVDAVRLRSGDPAAQDPRRNGNEDGLPFLRRRLRSGRRDARGQGHQHRGRSRPPDQRRHVVQQGSFGDPGGEQLAALAEGSLPSSGRESVGGKKLGLGAGADRRASQRNPR